MAPTKKSEPKPEVKARKERNRIENERRHAENLKRKAQGIPTPHEAKRMARAERRKPKQLAWKRAEDARIAARTIQDERTKASREELAKDLLKSVRKKKG